jgi:hypothetical protein
VSAVEYHTAHGDEEAVVIHDMTAGSEAATPPQPAERPFGEYLAEVSETATSRDLPPALPFCGVGAFVEHDRPYVPEPRSKTR